ncbi:MAG: FAD-dependent oxidoreductase [Rhodobacteraceae bacterium]|nr:MAG: FAD-dependent oxidoreductase [Paracoccaceae bacterium]
MSVTTRSEADVGYVEIDNPPVNAIGQSVRQGLLDAVRWAEKEKLTRVILSGKGRAFAAGADAREFDLPPQEPHLPDVMNAIDESFVPWIAAIDGVALGGGAEIAMACRMRIMSPRSQIGMPEVTLGVIPGAGGTQRLPRLVGLEKALEMISLGKPLGAKAALAAKLVHAVEEDPLEEAYMVNTEELGCIVPTWELPAPQPDAAVIDTARKTAARKTPNQIAPQRAIDVVEAGLSVPFHEALKAERATFLELRKGDQARALRHIFFAERGAKAPESITAEPVALDHVAVVGGGTMGAGIAYALLNAGMRVTLLETDEDGVARATANVEKVIAASLKRKLIDEAGAEDRRERLAAATDYAQASDAMLAIEAAFESMEVKKDVFTKLDAALPKGAILATNTSYLDINEIAATVPDPSRVVGLHFFAPAHIMKLLEIVRGDRTGDVALATGFALAKKLRKVPVLARVCDGFIGNRILARYREAADTVFMDGSTPWEVDAAMEEFGYAMGPYEAQDLSGLDIAHANRRRQDATRDPNRRYIPIADRMVELGKLGKKTGAGWYRYPGGGGKVEDPIVADLAIEESHLAKRDRTDYSAEEIRERLVLAMINEAADILDEGIAQTARDIDLVTVFGYGFPRWRGGLMHHADTIGAKAIVARLEELRKEDPVAWKISPLLERCAASGQPIAEAGPAT